MWSFVNYAVFSVRLQFAVKNVEEEEEEGTRG